MYLRRERATHFEVNATVTEACKRVDKQSELVGAIEYNLRHKGVIGIERRRDVAQGL